MVYKLNRKQLDRKIYKYEKLKIMETKMRHGCVTAYLIFVIIANSILAIIYLFAGNLITENLPGDVSIEIIIILGLIGVFNVICAVMLFKWKKWGFWGFVGTSIISLMINLAIGLGVGTSLAGLIGIAILYAILQIKQDNISAWENLE